MEIGKDVFENAIVDTSILIARNGKSDETISQSSGHGSPAHYKAFPPDENLWGQLRVQGERPWLALSATEQSVMDKMETAGTPLKEWDVAIYRGVTTGLNDAFIIDNKTKEALVAKDPKSAEIIKPVLRGRDIQRWQAAWAGLWLITTFPARQLAIDDYPAIKDHLLSFGKDKLEQSGKPLAGGGRSRKKTQHSWFEMQDVTAYYEDFKKEKLLWMQMTPQGRFAYSNDGIYGNAKVFIMTGEYLKYLCAVLNSRLITWFVSKTAVTTGMGLIQWQKFVVETIPIPKISAAEATPFHPLSGRHTGRQVRQPNTTDTSAQETKINHLVYNLYNLTPKEIAAGGKSNHEISF